MGLISNRLGIHSSNTSRAEIENKNEFRTFFLKKNHISRKDEIID